MNVVNVAANALLIYTFNLGVVGAGIATLLSRAVAAVIMLLLIRNQQNPIYLRGLYRVSFDGGLVRSILSVGVPRVLKTGLFNFGKLLVQTLIASLGTSAIAANAILGSISNIAIVRGLALASQLLRYLASASAPGITIRRSVT
jgi:Na+-driven multidrug efflux pump